MEIQVVQPFFGIADDTHKKLQQTNQRFTFCIHKLQVTYAGVVVSVAVDDLFGDRQMDVGAVVDVPVIVIQVSLGELNVFTDAANHFTAADDWLEDAGGSLLLAPVDVDFFPRRAAFYLHSENNKCVQNNRKLLLFKLLHKFAQGKK